MKNIYTGVVLLVVLALALLALQYKGSMGTKSGEVAVYSNPEIGLEFSYRTGPEGYVIQESIPMAVDPDLVRFVHVVPASVANLPPPEGGEGPAQISISVYRNSKNEWSGQWAESHTQYSNIGLKQGEVAEAVVGGANAVRYMRDGLYPAEVVVVAHGGLVYVFDGAYLEPESALKKDFAPLVESVKFIPIVDESAGAPVSGKLDINAVCEGALAYMSFPSGKEADAFLAECKAGNRPEVIEKYKKDNGLDGATI